MSGAAELLILGAGFAGLGAGVEARRRGLDSLILERADEVGGLCRSTEVHGCTFDFGPKVLVLDDSPVKDELLAVLDHGYERYPMHQQTYVDGAGLVGFPVQRHLIDLPAEERALVLASMAQAWAHQEPPTNYQDWLVSQFGRRLCETVLFPYEEKKWNLPLTALGHEWALSRPTAVSRAEIVAGALRKLPAEGSYYYPRAGGIAAVSKAVARHAGPIAPGHNVTEINLPGRYVVANGTRFGYQRLISTLPLDQALAITTGLPSDLHDAARDTLRWLGVRVFNLVFAGEHQLPGTAIHFPSPDVVFRRVCVLPNLCPPLARPGLTPISVELSLSATEPAPSPADQFAVVLADLAEVKGFAGLGAPLDWQALTLEHAYPLQHEGLRPAVEAIRAGYAAFGVRHCGRGGSFQYCNGDAAYAQGQRTVREQH